MNLLGERNLRRLFRASLWLKAAHSMIEVAGGLLLYRVPHETITRLLQRLTWAELRDDPHDLVANFLRQAAQNFGASAQTFAAWYLFSHGAIKLVLVAAILADRRWAYPLFIAAMGAFIGYQFHLMTLQRSFALVAITLLDIVVLALAIHEYRYRNRERRRTQRSAR